MSDRNPVPKNKPNKSKETKGIYSIYYIAKDGDAEIQVDTVSAANVTIARRLAKSRFPSSTILHVRKVTTRGEADDLPSARFIKGQFRESHFADDPARSGK